MSTIKNEKMLETFKKLNEMFEGKLSQIKDFDFADFDFDILNKKFEPVEFKTRTDEKNYYIDLSAVGMTKDDISIEVENDVLIVSGKVNKESAHSSFHKNFTQKIRLEDDSDFKSITADMSNGILTVVIPKKEKSTIKVTIK